MLHDCKFRVASFMFPFPVRLSTQIFRHVQVLLISLLRVWCKISQSISGLLSNKYKGTLALNRCSVGFL